MRNAIWMFVILALGVAYTIYGIFTFVPEQPAPIQFEDVESIMARNREEAKLSGTEQVISLTAEEQAVKRAFVTRINQSVETYEAILPNANRRVAPIIKIFSDYTRNTSLPPVFVNSNTPQGYYALQFPTGAARDVQEEKTGALSCTGGTGTGLAVSVAYTLIGDDRANTLSCEASTNPQSALVLVGGPGNDTMRVGTSTTIFHPGSGDDIIKVSGGQAFIVLEAGWGKDELEIDCTNARVDLNNLPANMNTSWTWPYNNFVIFGPTINREDVIWESTNTLLNQRTGDTLKVNDRCVNLVFYTPEPLKTPVENTVESGTQSAPAAQ